MFWVVNELQKSHAFSIISKELDKGLSTLSKLIWLLDVKILRVLTPKGDNSVIRKDVLFGARRTKFES